MLTQVYPIFFYHNFYPRIGGCMNQKWESFSHQLELEFWNSSLTGLQKKGDVKPKRCVKWKLVCIKIDESGRQAMQKKRQDNEKDSGCFYKMFHYPYNKSFSLFLSYLKQNLVIYWKISVPYN